MNIAYLISLASLIVAALSLARNFNKDKSDSLKEEDLKFDSIEKSLVKANMKLDQVCSTTNETRTDIKSLNNDIRALDKRVVILERDLKTLYNQVDEIRKEKA